MDINRRVCNSCVQYRYGIHGSMQQYIRIRLTTCFYKIKEKEGKRSGETFAAAERAAERKTCGFRAKPSLDRRFCGCDFMNQTFDLWHSFIWPLKRAKYALFIRSCEPRATHYLSRLRRPLYMKLVLQLISLSDSRNVYITVNPPPPIARCLI